MWSCWSLLRHNLLDSKINTVLSMCQDTNLLNPVHGIVQSVVYHEESPPQYQPSYLQSKPCPPGEKPPQRAAQTRLRVFSGFGFNGLWRFAGPFSKVAAPPPSAAGPRPRRATPMWRLPGSDSSCAFSKRRSPTTPS